MIRHVLGPEIATLLGATRALSRLNIWVPPFPGFGNHASNQRGLPCRKSISSASRIERESLRNVVKKLKGSSEKMRRAQVLLKANADGPNWTDARIAEAFSCRTKTVENIRKRLVNEGFGIVLNGKKRELPPRAKTLDGEQEARVIAMRLSKPPKGFANWTLRLLAEKVVELEIVDSVSPETIRKTLKKTE